MSTTSLKAFIPRMASVLGATPAALYERQRALVRDGILEADEGKGPGGGVRANDKSIALLLISFLSTESLSNSAERTALISGLTPFETKYKKYPMDTFGNALAIFISHKFFLPDLKYICISRTNAYASIHWMGIQKSFKPSGAIMPKIRVEVTIDGDVIRAIANDIRSMKIQEDTGEVEIYQKMLREWKF